MKIYIQRFLITMTMLLLPTILVACDICGCGAGTSYLGMMPEYNNNIVGVRYRYSAMRTHLGPQQSTTYLTTDEQFQVMEAWAALKIKKNWRIMAQVPYSFISKTNLAESETESTSGISDVQVLAQYHIWNKKHNLGYQLLIFDAWLGGGFKLPTGKYKSYNTNNSLNLFQLGSGSWDAVLQGALDIRLQDVGFNMNALYKINSANSSAYYYGNKLALNGQFYYKFSLGKDINLVPNLGIKYEKNRRDQQRNVVLDATGGNITKLSFGLELKLVQFFFGMQYQKVLQQKVGLGLLQIKDNYTVHLGVNL